MSAYHLSHKRMFPWALEWGADGCEEEAEESRLGKIIENCLLRTFPHDDEIKFTSHLARLFYHFSIKRSLL